MRLLLIGTMDGQIGAASQIAIKKGGSVIHAVDVGEALDLLRSGKGADLIMIDVRLDIYSLVESLNSERISIPVVACGVAADAKAAVKAIKAGAKEYIPLPPDAELIGEILSAVSMESAQVICKDPAMENLLKLAKQVAPSTASVLITGESGTGKEVIAKYIHANSKRAGEPFIAVNCAAIPENLLESELFGYEKAPLPEPSHGASENSKKPTAERCCLMKSRKWTSGFRLNCCAPFRNAKSTASAAKPPLTLTCAFWQRQTAICTKPSKTKSFAKTCISD